MKVAAIVVCAGQGKRLGRPDKAVLDLAGKPLFFHACSQFLKNKQIVQLVLVLRPKNFPLARKLIADPRLVLAGGGQERSDSVYCGLQALDKDITHVLVHDGARPFVSPETVQKIITGLRANPAVICGVYSRDTVKLTKNFRVVKTLLRENIFLAHTPQGFERELLNTVYRKLRGQRFYDDAQVVELCGGKVKVVEGNQDNFKITFPHDISLAKAMLESGRYRVGLGFDIHKFSKAKKDLILAGVKIPADISLEAVSDGDLVLHALADGICGACGLGDIGDYFPPSDPACRGMNSAKILDFILGKTRGKFELVNVDITIISEKPKLAAHKSRMVKSLKKLLPQTAVNLKIKSKEGLDILGGRKAMTCLANVLVKSL